MIRVGVTGASGYVGRALVARLESDGHQVTTLGRRAVGEREHRYADFSSPVHDDLLQGMDAVIHLAANTDGKAGVLPQAEIAFASALVAQAKSRRCRLVFVSSQAAATDAPSDYGRTKAAIEALVLNAGAGVVVRPGMVYGQQPAGLYGVLEMIVRKLPLLPALFAPTPFVQPVHVDDLAGALSRLCAPVAGLGEVVSVAGPPVPFSEFLQAIARFRVRRPRAYLPTPVGALRPLLSIGSRIFGPRLSPSRLDSLTRLPRLDASQDLAVLGSPLRSLREGLSPPGIARRALLREADLLARATLGRKSTRALARRYARALSSLGSNHALSYPWWVGPSMLAAFDSPASRANIQPGSLAWRLGVLTRLAETEPALANSFIRVGLPTSRWSVVDSMVRVALLESRCRLLRPLVARWAGSKA